MNNDPFDVRLPLLLLLLGLVGLLVLGLSFMVVVVVLGRFPLVVLVLEGDQRSLKSSSCRRNFSPRY